MDRKLLILDIDGTLTNSRKELTAATKAAILDMQERGHQCILASGRAPSGMLPLAKELEFAKYGGYLLSFNGGKITNCQTGQILYQKLVPVKFLPIIHQFATEHNCGLITYEEKTLISNGIINEYAELESRQENAPIKVVHQFLEYVTYDMNKCLLCTTPELAAQYEPLLQKLLGDSLDIYRSDPYYIEIVPKGVNKAASLGKLLPAIGFSAQNCVACGDGFNDLDMLRFAGIGVAMGNAVQALKDIADIITLSNDDDGIVPIIKKFFN